MNPALDPHFIQKVGERCSQLVDACARLMDPEKGCPWDRVQTPESLIPYVLEEAYELVFAILSGNKQAILEELGDFLYQAVIQAEWFRRQGYFDLSDVMESLRQKLIRRHPHVFGQKTLETIEEVKAQWQAIKAQEKKSASTPVTPESWVTPQLQGPQMAWAMAFAVGQWSATVGLDWSQAQEVWLKVQEEWHEWQQALSQSQENLIEEELGDLLFSLVQWCRKSRIDGLVALMKATQRFLQRVQEAWKLSGLSWSDFCQLPPAEKERWYQVAKKNLSSRSSK